MNAEQRSKLVSPPQTRPSNIPAVNYDRALSGLYYALEYVLAPPHYASDEEIRNTLSLAHAYIARAEEYLAIRAGL